MRELMEGNGNRGCLTLILWVVTVAVSAGSGILAWNWIDPGSWIGGLFWFIIWAVMTLVGRAIGIGIIAILGGMD